MLLSQRLRNAAPSVNQATKNAHIVNRSNLKTHHNIRKYIPPQQVFTGGSSSSTATVDSAASPDPTADEQDKDYSALFQGLSKTLNRKWRYDRVGKADNANPETESDLENMSITSMKTTDMSPHIFDRIFRLVKDFGNKKDMERYGRYIMKRMRSRTSSEVPKVLPSRFLPEHENGSPMDRITKDPVYIAAVMGYDEINENLEKQYDMAQAKLRGEKVDAKVGEKDTKESDAKETDKTSDAEQSKDKSKLDWSKDVRKKPMANFARLAQAYADDQQHKLYQMTWSPHSALAYLAHRYPAVYASNFRVMYEISKRCPDFRPVKMLDYGAGPAPSIAAAFETWKNSDTETEGGKPNEPSNKNYNST